jgi:hypothetical protein
LIYNLVMRPNAHWTEDQVEQTFYQLLEERKLEEIEEEQEGRYRPTQEGGWEEGGGEEEEGGATN